MANSRWAYEWKSGSPGNRRDPTPYEAHYAKASINHPNWSCTGYGSAYAASISYGLSFGGQLRLRTKLADALKGSARASLALTAADAGTSLLMIADRASSLLGAVRALRRGNLGEVYHHLKIPNNSVRRTHKWANPSTSRDSAANTWLELQFGWLPLISDVYAAAKVLESNPATNTVRVFISDVKRDPRTHENHYNDGSTVMDDRWTVWTSVDAAAGASLKGINPNLLGASQLGLTNPAHVLWDLVPFSFIADWFLPIGAYLKSFDDFYGLEMSMPWYTVRVKATGQSRSYGFSPWWAPYDYTMASTATHIRRYPSTVPIPSIFDLRPKALTSYLWKAATSVALLQQAFR